MRCNPGSQLEEQQCLAIPKAAPATEASGKHTLSKSPEKKHDVEKHEFGEEMRNAVLWHSQDETEAAAPSTPPSIAERPPE